jgi:hypothetical protein
VGLRRGKVKGGCIEYHSHSSNTINHFNVVCERGERVDISNQQSTHCFIVELCWESVVQLSLSQSILLIPFRITLCIQFNSHILFISQLSSSIYQCQLIVM